MFEGYTGPLALLCDACGEPVSNDDHNFNPPVYVECDNSMTFTRLKRPTQDRLDRREQRSASIGDVENTV
jgi:hypothetical protein